MDESGAMYAPQSPDHSAYHAYPNQMSHVQPRQYRASVAHPSPYAPKDPYGKVATAPRNGKMPRVAVIDDEGDDNEWLPDAPEEVTPRVSGRSNKGKRERGASLSGAAEGVEVKTKFPVARIKRIMQADEDVGKVAQVTPVVVCKS